MACYINTACRFSPAEQMHASVIECEPYLSVENTAILW